MRKIRIAQIGTSLNSHGKPIFRTLTELSDVFEIVGYALPEGEREKFPTQMDVFEGYTEMTVEEILGNPEIEAVAVETEEIYITKYALMVAKAGKHLHMEKPGGREPEAFRELVAILKEKGLVFSTGYMYRFNPKIIEAMEKIERGDLGKIYAVEAHMDCRHTPEVRSWLGNFPGGMTFFLGCHLIDLVVQILGKPQNVIPLNRSSGRDGLATEDMGLAVLEYPHAFATVKTTDVEMGGFWRRKLTVCGTNGTVELCPLEICVPDSQWLVSTVKTEYTGQKLHDGGVSTETPTFDRYETMMQTFAAYVRGEGENPYTYDYELELFRIILQCCGVKET